MDSTQLTNLTSEVNAFTSFLKTYDNMVAAFLGGTANTCPHFLESITTLSNDVSYGIAYQEVWSSGQTISFGALTEFVYLVYGVKRSQSVISATKAMYYTNNDSDIIVDQNFFSGEVAKILSYIQGKAPGQGIIT